MFLSSNEDILKRVSEQTGFHVDMIRCIEVDFYAGIKDVLSDPKKLKGGYIHLNQFAKFRFAHKKYNKVIKTFEAKGLNESNRYHELKTKFNELYHSIEIKERKYGIDDGRNPPSE